MKQSEQTIESTRSGSPASLASVAIAFGLLVLVVFGYPQPVPVSEAKTVRAKEDVSMIPVKKAPNVTTNEAKAIRPLPFTAQQSGISRHELQRHNLGIPGREAIQVVVGFEPEAAFGKHWHPGEEIVYVLEGSLEYSIEGKPPVTLKSGEVLFIPAGAIHSAKNVGKGNAKELATYIVEKEKPLLTMVK